MQLLIAEKPSVARDIAEVIARKGKDKFKNQEGFLEGDNYLIGWAVGHLLELAMPEQYAPEYEKWDIENLPIFPERFRIYPKEETKRQLNILINLLKREDIEYVINACDAGREGELIFRYIIEYSNCRKPQKRLWLSETTDEAVWKALKEMKDAREYDSLAMAAKARAEADWLVGINATRAYSVKYKEKLSVGRVQTPTLALVVGRDLEIANFTPVTYFQLKASFLCNGFMYSGIWFDSEKDRFDTKEEAQRILTAVQNEKQGIIKSLQTKEIKENPPLLYNLNDLQRDANKIYGLSAQNTLDTAQSLYERKFITYPRTDSRYLTTEMAKTLEERIKALAKTELGPWTEQINNYDLTLRHVDDTKVSDHTAIITTVVIPDFKELNEKEKAVYTLVAKRFIAIFYPPFIYDRIELVTEVKGQMFKSKGRHIKDMGWKEIYAGDEKDEEEEETVLAVSQEDITEIQKIELMEKTTSPPKRYTEADLLSAMENAGQQINDESLKEIMKGKGIGTPATRAAIIEKLIKTGYLERKNKQLISTAKGRKLIELVSPLLKTPEMTAEWEEKLLKIEEGSYQAEKFNNEIKKYVASTVEEVKQIQNTGNIFAKELQSLGKCPICGKPVLENKKGYGCSGWREGCKFVIWKEIAGKKITSGQAKKLLERGKTDKIKGFKSKAGNSFDAVLKFNEEFKVVFELEREGR